MDAEDYKNGQVILIDKPLEWTSFQVVNKIRWQIRRKYKLKKIKVGHAGTLDPLATGLLVICTGKFTKSLANLQAERKEYSGTISLGASTPSYDMETEINQNFPTDHISNSEIQKTASLFLGESKQKPPLFSAIKKDGIRLYELARKGESTEIKSRFINIYKFEITKIDMPNISFLVSCSKGTYIRSLANDFGKALNSGAYLSSLRRTKSGNYSLEDAVSPLDFVRNLD